MAILLDNKVLQAAEAQIEKQLLPDVQEDYAKIVVAGMKAALHGGIESSVLVARLRKSADPISDCAKGAISLVMMLGNQSHGTMPTKALIPASFTLMLQALDFADKANVVKVGSDELVKATHVWSNRIMNVFGITKEKLTKMAELSHKVMADPAQMEIVNRRAGTVKDPRSSTPTEMPQGMINKGAANGV